MSQFGTDFWAGGGETHLRLLYTDINVKLHNRATTNNGNDIIVTKAPDRIQSVRSVMSSASGTVMTDDAYEIVVGVCDVRVWMNVRSHVEAFQREGDVRGDLGGEHKLVSEPL